MESKICTKCKIEQPLGNYYLKNKLYPDRGCKSECKECDKKRKITPITVIPDLEGEIWLPFPIHEIRDKFSISNLGRLKRIELSVNKTEKIRKWSILKGYPYITTKVNGVARLFLGHRMVALAFIPNPENKPEVNHKKGIKIDIRASELEWSTSKENVDHAWETGLNTSSPGEKNGQAKLTESQVLEIRTIGGNLPQKVVAEIYGIKEHNVYQILSRKRWKHI